MLLFLLKLAHDLRRRKLRRQLLERETLAALSNSLLHLFNLKLANIVD